jgi:hypothetical protein
MPRLACLDSPNSHVSQRRRDIGHPAAKALELSTLAQTHAPRTVNVKEDFVNRRIAKKSLAAFAGLSHGEAECTNPGHVFYLIGG